MRGWRGWPARRQASRRRATGGAARVLLRPPARLLEELTRQSLPPRPRPRCGRPRGWQSAAPAPSRLRAVGGAAGAAETTETFGPARPAWRHLERHGSTAALPQLVSPPSQHAARHAASPGHSSSKLHVTLSPGITISVPSGSVTVPAGGRAGWAEGEQAGARRRVRRAGTGALRCAHRAATTAGHSGSRQASRTRDVCGAEEELRLVVGHERGVAPALLLQAGAEQLEQLGRGEGRASNTCQACSQGFGPCRACRAPARHPPSHTHP